MEYRVERFTFFPSYYEAGKCIEDPNERLSFYESLMEYAFFGTLPEFGDKLAAMFLLSKPNIDESLKRIKQCKINGAKGGAPAGNQNAKKKTTHGLNENNTDKNKEEDKEDGKGKCTVSDDREETSSRSNINFEKIYAGS